MIDVRSDGGDRYTIRIGTHTIRVDQPPEDGGTGTAPTPTELFVASLAACTAHYAGRFLARHGVNARGLEVRCAFTFATDRPSRVGEVALELIVPPELPPKLHDRLRAVVDHCTVKNSIATAPEMHLQISRAGRPAA
jgi:uncharacterized OsmC-like protein